MNTNSIKLSAMTLCAVMVAMLGAATAVAQSPSQRDAKPAEVKAPEGSALAALAWLEGCWRGTVNRREFREHWMPLRGNLLIGVSHTVMQDKTQGFEYLRLESRPDGVYYVTVQPGQKESAFRLADQSVDRAEGRNDQIFTFVNPALDFPQKITYRRASEGWLYAAVDGKVGGADRQATYPMRRIDCESGEVIPR
jgi:hypothetical protein